MAATRSHLNPGFKVVFAGIGMVEDAIFLSRAALEWRHVRRDRSDDSSMNTDRDRLRRELRARRRELPAAQRIAAADALAAQLLALPFAPERGYVAGYWAMDGEIALHAWQLRLPRGCVYCLPVLAGDVL